MEIVMVLALIGLLSAIAVPRFGDWRARMAVRRAVEETAAFYQNARFAAIFRGTRVRIEFQPDTLVAVYEGVSDSVFLSQAGPDRDGVSLNTSRAVIRILPTGIGSGGSNTTLVFRRGLYAESLTTSRLGRLKRW